MYKPILFYPHHESHKSIFKKSYFVNKIKIHHFYFAYKTEIYYLCYGNRIKIRKYEQEYPENGYCG